MSVLQAVLWPAAGETRILLEQDRRPLLRARLAPLLRAHPAAMGALLEALSLWQTTRLHAVLAVVPGADGWSWTPAPLRSERVTFDTCLVGRAARLSDLRRLVQDRHTDQRSDEPFGGGHAE